MQNEQFSSLKIKVTQWLTQFSQLEAAGKIRETDLEGFYQKKAEFEEVISNLDAISSKANLAWKGHLQAALLPQGLKTMLQSLLEGIEGLVEADAIAYIDMVAAYYEKNIHSQEDARMKETASTALWGMVRTDLEANALNATGQVIHEAFLDIWKNQENPFDFSLKDAPTWDEAVSEITGSIENFGGAKVVVPFSGDWKINDLDVFSKLKKIGVSIKPLQVSVKGSFDRNNWVQHNTTDFNDWLTNQSTQFLRSSIGAKLGGFGEAAMLKGKGGVTVFSESGLKKVFDPWLVGGLKVDFLKISGGGGITKDEDKLSASLEAVSLHFFVQLKTVELFKLFTKLDKKVIQDITIEVRASIGLAADLLPKNLGSAARGIDKEDRKKLKEIKKASKDAIKEHKKAAKAKVRHDEAIEKLEELKKNKSPFPKQQKQQKLVQKLETELLEASKTLKKTSSHIDNLVKGLEKPISRVASGILRNQAALQAAKLIAKAIPVLNVTLLVIDIGQTCWIVGSWIHDSIEESHRLSSLMTEAQIQGRVRQLLDVMADAKLSVPDLTEKTVAFYENLEKFLNSMTEHEFELMLENYRTGSFEAVPGFSLERWKEVMGKLKTYDIEVLRSTRSMGDNLQPVANAHVLETRFIEPIMVDELSDNTWEGRKYPVVKKIVKQDDNGAVIAGPVEAKSPDLYYTIKEVIEKDNKWYVQVVINSQVTFDLPEISSMPLVFNETRYYNVTDRRFCVKP